jgi:membrane protease YdiL (CAAX protease family)
LRYLAAMTEPPDPVWLLPAELLALAGCALAPWLLPFSLPMVLPLLGVATLSIAVRRRTLLTEPHAGASLGTGDALAIGAGAGLAALGLSVALATPLLEGAGAAVEWSVYPAVRGSLGQLLTAAILVAALAFAEETIYRRWILERAYQLGASGSGSILIAGAAEALIGPGPLGARLGMALFGVALGMLYWRGGRRLAPSLAARLAFGLGALVLQALQWVD